MKRWQIILLVIILLLILLIGGSTLTIRRAIRQPFPQTAGTLSLPGLTDTVDVYRDEYGVPHIYAQNEADLYFAQGYVHAQDRFWQMEFWRHIGQGRISEIVGEPGLDSDKFIRTVGWNRAGRETVDFYAAEAPQFLGVVEAYSAGVNAYIDANRDQLSVNYTILSTVNDAWEIEPWTPLNTITWGIVMSHDLSGNYVRKARSGSGLPHIGWSS